VRCVAIRLRPHTNYESVGTLSNVWEGSLSSSEQAALRKESYSRRGALVQTLSSQLTPQPQPLPDACGLSMTRNALPMSSVAKSTVAPLTSGSETASMSRVEGVMLGCARWLWMAGREGRWEEEVARGERRS
jgi:hypothetical protein